MVLIKFDKLRQKLADTTELEAHAEANKVVFSVKFPGNPDADKFVQELSPEEKKEDVKEEAPAETTEEATEAEEETE